MNKIGIQKLDEFLLNCPEISQDEREDILEHTSYLVDNDTVICQECKAEIPEYRFCPMCGTEQDAYPYDEIENDTEPLDAQKVKDRVLPFIQKNSDRDGEIGIAVLKKNFTPEELDLMMETGYIYEPIIGKVKAT